MRSIQCAAVALILLGITSITLGFVSGQVPPPPSPPKLLSQYGVVRVYASTSFNTRVQITITSREAAPFFVSGLTLFLSIPASSNIVLSSINVDSMGLIQVSGSGATSSQVVIVTSGSTYGDIVQSMPSYLSFLIVKDPLGNNAIIANGGGSGGVVIAVGILSGAYSGGATLSAVATILAPSDTIVTMTIG